MQEQIGWVVGPERSRRGASIGPWGCAAGGTRGPPSTVEAPHHSRGRVPSVPRQRGEPEQDLIRLYLTDVAQYALLTKGDETRLAQAIEAGHEAEARLEAAESSLTQAQQRELRVNVQSGRDAERRFVHANLRLVVSIAKRYQVSGLPLLDLIQEGNLGLMHAVEKFDWRKS